MFCFFTLEHSASENITRTAFRHLCFVTIFHLNMTSAGALRQCGCPGSPEEVEAVRAWMTMHEFEAPSDLRMAAGVRESLGALLDLARDFNETGRYKTRLPRKAAEILIAVLRRCIPSSRLADGAKLEATPLLFYADLARLYDGPDDAAHLRRCSLDKRAKRMQTKACFACNRGHE